MLLNPMLVVEALVHSRVNAGRWMLEETLAEGIVRLEAIDCEITLDEVHLKVVNAQA